MPTKFLRQAEPCSFPKSRNPKLEILTLNLSISTSRGPTTRWVPLHPPSMRSPEPRARAPNLKPQTMNHAPETPKTKTPPPKIYNKNTKNKPRQKGGGSARAVGSLPSALDLLLRLGTHPKSHSELLASVLSFSWFLVTIARHQDTIASPEYSSPDP